MAAISDNQINLIALKKVDPQVIEVLDTASSVKLYKYDKALKTWELTDIEGSLFLYKRSLSPYFGIIVMNRNSMTNSIEMITSDMKLQMQVPHLCHRNYKGEIIAYWFYEEKDLRRITKQIQMLISSQSHTEKNNSLSLENEKNLKSNKPIQDIMAMLSQAHLEYLKNASKENKSSNLNSEKKFDKDISLNGIAKEKISPISIAKSELFMPHSVLKNCASNSLKNLSSSNLSQSFPSTQYPLLLERSISMVETNSLSDEFGLIKEKIENVKHIPYVRNKNFDNPYVYEKQNIARRLSPLFSFDEEIGTSEIETCSNFNVEDNIFDSSCLNIASELETPDSFKKPSSHHFSSINGTSRLDSERKLHIECLKGSLLATFRDDSDILMKIHEAYISSLKMHFTPKK